MKKLLSVVLACAMIFTMVLPMSVFAEGEVTISTAEAVTIELDEYATTNVVAYADDDSGNGSAVSAGWGTEAVTVNVPVVISESGMYDLVYIASNYKDTATPNDFSMITFDLNDGTTTKTIASTANDTVIDELDGKYAAFTRVDVDKFKQTAYLTEGTYTLVANITRAGGLYRGLMDYITFSASNETISADAATTIEMENYVIDKTNNIITDTGASGGKYVNQGYATGDSAVCALQIPVTVAESGFYNFEYVATDYTKLSDLNEGNRVTFKVGDTSLSGTATDDELALTTTPSGAPASKFTGKVYLAEGTYTLTTSITKAYGVWRFMLDYIKFSAVEPEELSETQATTVELSDYSVKPAVVQTEADGENKVITTTWSSTPTEAYAWLDVAASGYYDIEYISNAPQSGSYGAARFYLDDTEIASALTDTGVEASGYTLWTGTAVKKYTKGKVYIEAGRYTLKFEFTAGGGANYRGLADYIKFTPTAVEETIAADAETLIEFEDYATGTLNDLASDGELVASAGTSTKPSITVITNVAASGYYDIEYAIGNNKGTVNYISPVELKLGDVSLGKSNTYGGTELGAGGFSAAPLTKYTNTVYLEAGKQYLDVDVTMTTADNLYKYQVDYVKFTPAVAIATITGEGTQTVNYETLAGSSVLKTANATTGNQVVMTYDGSFTGIAKLIEVEVAGTYDIEYVANSYNANFGTPAFKLDGVAIAGEKTSVSVAADYPDLTWEGSAYTEMTKFTIEDVELAAGTYLLSYEVPKAGGLYRGVVDYISFTAAVEEEPEVNAATTIAWEEGTNNVVVTSAIEGSAKVIWVSYDANGKMVSWKTSEELTLTNVGSQTVNVPAGFETSARKKAMLWTNTTNCKPLAAFID